MVYTEPHFRLLFVRVGLRVHLVISEAGEPVECSLAAGSEVDIKVFENLNTDLPEGSTMLADKGYPDYDHENLLGEVGLHLKAQRKKYLKRPMSAWGRFSASRSASRWQRFAAR